MAEIIIATPPSGSWRWILRQRFDDQFYRLLFRWNVRAGAWYVDFAGNDSVATVRGVKMNLGLDKLAPYKHRNVPQGDFRVTDSSGQGLEPDLQSFGERVVVSYIEFEPVERTTEINPYIPPS